MHLFCFTGEEGVKFDVVNAQTYAGYVVHVGSLSHGSIKVGPTLLQGQQLSLAVYIGDDHCICPC